MPKIVTVRELDNTVVLMWPPHPTATSYVVTRSDPANPAPVTVATVTHGAHYTSSIPLSWWRDTTCVNGTTYTYEVRAVTSTATLTGDYARAVATPTPVPRTRVAPRYRARLANNYYNYPSSDVIRQNDAVVINAARWDTIGGPGARETAPTTGFLRYANLRYYNPTDTVAQESPNMLAAEIQSSWIMRGGDGQPLINSGHAWLTALDPGAAGYKEAFLAYLLRQAKTYGWRGYLLDDLAIDGTQWLESGKTLPAKYAGNPAAWRQAQFDLALHVSNGLRDHGLLAVGNVGGMSWNSPLSAAYEDFLAQVLPFDGFQIEFSVTNQWTNTGQETLTQDWSELGWRHGTVDEPGCTATAVQHGCVPWLGDYCGNAALSTQRVNFLAALNVMVSTEQVRAITLVSPRDNADLPVLPPSLEGVLGPITKTGTGCYTRKIYWTENGAAKVTQCRLNGTNTAATIDGVSVPAYTATFTGAPNGGRVRPAPLPHQRPHASQVDGLTALITRIVTETVASTGALAPGVPVVVVYNAGWPANRPCSTSNPVILTGHSADVAPPSWWTVAGDQSWPTT